MGFKLLSPWHNLMVPCRPNALSSLPILAAVQYGTQRTKTEGSSLMPVTYFLITTFMLQKEANQGHGNELT